MRERNWGVVSWWRLVEVILLRVIFWFFVGRFIGWWGIG